MAKNKTLNNRYRVNPYPGGLTPPPGWNPTANDTPMVERVRRMRQGGGSPLWSGQAVVGKSDPAPQVSVPYRQATMSASAPTVNVPQTRQAVVGKSDPAPQVSVPSVNVPQTRQAVFGTSAPAPTVNVPSGQKTPPQTPPPPAAVPPPVPAPTPPAPGALPSPTPRPPETPTTPPTPDTATKPYELGYYEQQAVQPAMGALQARAAGESPVDRRIANLYLGYLRAGNEAEKAAAAQEMAQLGVSPQAAAARMAMLGQRQGSQEAQTAGQLAVSSQERAAQAAQQLGQLGMQGAGLEQRKYEFGEEMGYKRDVLTEEQRQFDEKMDMARDEYEDTKQWTEFLRAAEYGSDKEVAEAYREVFGSEITSDAMINEIRDYARRTRENELEQQELTTEGMELKNMATSLGISSTRMTSVARDIANGMPLSAINEAYGTDMTDAQYQSVFNNLNYDKQLGAVQQLLTTGGEENINQAKILLEGMYNGLSFDVEPLIRADNIANFNDGLALASDLAQRHNWDELPIGTRNEMMELWGITDPSQAEEMYNQAKVNYFDDMIGMVEESTVFNDEEKEFMKGFIINLMTGEYGIERVKEYKVYNAKGEEITTTKGRKYAEEAMPEGGSIEETDNWAYIERDVTGRGEPEPTPVEGWEAWKMDHVPDESRHEPWVSEGNYTLAASYFGKDPKDLTWDEMQEWSKTPEGGALIQLQETGDTLFKPNTTTPNYTEDELNAIINAPDGSPLATMRTNVLTELDFPDSVNPGKGKMSHPSTATEAWLENNAGKVFEVPWFWRSDPDTPEYLIVKGTYEKTPNTVVYDFYNLKGNLVTKTVKAPLPA